MDAMRLYQPDELGPDGYPPAWHRQEGGAASSIKVLVRLAAGNRCVRCQHPYTKETASKKGEWSPCDHACDHDGPIGVRSLDGGWITDGPLLDVPGVTHFAQWRILTVHHLTGCWGNTTEAKRDCRWWNLAALCQVCHLQIQGKVQMERAFIFEHSDWFKPYAAGWYAWKYEGREITRGEAEADLERLLALERLA